MHRPFLWLTLLPCYVVALSPGTWRTHAVAPESSLLKVKKDIKPEYAAAIAVNPCTAYRLLNDFADLKPGTAIAPHFAPARTLEPAPVPTVSGWAFSRRCDVAW